MKNFFDPQKPIWSFFGKLLDAIVLHILWLVCCLPVVTFGASTTALYDIMLRLAEDRGGHNYRRFFRSFKDNLRQGIPMGLIFLGGEGALVYSFFLLTRVETLNPAFPGLRIVSAIMTVFVLMVFEYAFALLARFENTVLQTLKNAFLMALRYIGWTIVMTAILVGFYSLIYFFEEYFFPLLIFGFGLIALMQAYVLSHIFRPFVEAQEHTADEDKEKTEQDRAGFISFRDQ